MRFSPSPLDVPQYLVSTGVDGNCCIWKWDSIAGLFSTEVFSSLPFPLAHSGMTSQHSFL